MRSVHLCLLFGAALLLCACGGGSGRAEEEPDDLTWGSSPGFTMLRPADPGVTPPPTGFASSEGDGTAASLKVLACAREGTSDLDVILVSFTTEQVLLGTMSIGEDGCGFVEYEYSETNPLPFGAATLADYFGFILHLKDTDGTLILWGPFPIPEEE